MVAGDAAEGGIDDEDLVDSMSALRITHFAKVSAPMPFCTLGILLQHCFVETISSLVKYLTLGGRLSGGRGAIIFLIWWDVIITRYTVSRVAAAEAHSANCSPI